MLQKVKTPDKELVYQLTDSQRRLLGYLTTLLGGIDETQEILQETNLVRGRQGASASGLPHQTSPMMVRVRARFRRRS